MNTNNQDCQDDYKELIGLFTLKPVIPNLEDRKFYIEFITLKVSKNQPPLYHRWQVHEFDYNV